MLAARHTPIPSAIRPLSAFIPSRQDDMSRVTEGLFCTDLWEPGIRFPRATRPETATSRRNR
jgi:hypothetical protein